LIYVWPPGVARTIAAAAPAAPGSAKTDSSTTALDEGQMPPAPGKRTSGDLKGTVLARMLREDMPDTR